jgi:hypothetical protein
LQRVALHWSLWCQGSQEVVWVALLAYRAGRPTRCGQPAEIGSGGMCMECYPSHFDDGQLNQRYANEKE